MMAFDGRIRSAGTLSSTLSSLSSPSIEPASDPHCSELIACTGITFTDYFAAFGAMIDNFRHSLLLSLPGCNLLHSSHKGKNREEDEPLRTSTSNSITCLVSSEDERKVNCFESLLGCLGCSHLRVRFSLGIEGG